MSFARRLAPMMAALVLLAALPPASAASTVDPAGDVEMRVGLAGAPAVACTSDAIDIVRFEVSAQGGELVVALDFADPDAEPRCQGGLPMARSQPASYRVEMEDASGGWVSVLGGGSCGGATCVWVGDFEGYAERVAFSGGLVGDRWEVRVPLAGTDVAGQPYDLRGRTFSSGAFAYDVAGAGNVLHAVYYSVSFDDRASLPPVTL